MKIFSATILIAIAFSLIACSGYREEKLKKSGAAVIAEIENFRTTNSRLPENLSDIHLEETEEGPFYYRRTDDSSYEIWFGTDLGESITYDSRSQRWNP